MNERTLQVFRFRAMNTNIEAILQCANEQVKQMGASLVNGFEYAERRFSRFLPDSELQYVNSRAGEICMISQDMLDVLQLADSCSKRTNGIFSLHVLRALQQIGYQDSFEKIKDSTVIMKEDTQQEMQFLRLYPEMGSMQMSKSSQLDLGGIVKSWTVMQMAEMLSRSAPSGFINAGGDSQMWGSDSQEPWRFGIEHPWKPEQEIGQVELNNGGIATSSKLGRKWDTHQGTMHHLIDPRTMLPSGSSVVQCTVIGADVTQCEVWAKVLCIAGLQEGLALLKQQAPEYEAFIFTEEQKIYFYGSAASWNKHAKHIPLDEWIEAP